MTNRLTEVMDRLDVRVSEEDIDQEDRLLSEWPVNVEVKIRGLGATATIGEVLAKHLETLQLDASSKGGS